MTLGLRGKLLGITLAVVLGAFGAVLFFATSTAREGLVGLSDVNLEQGAENLARALVASLDDARADAVTTARLDLAAEAIDSGDPKNFLWYADEIVGTKEKYAALVVADAEGRVVASNEVRRGGGRMPRLAGRRLDRSWVPQALRAPRERATWIGPSRPAVLEGALASGERVVGFALPVFDVTDDRIGTLALFVSLDWLGELAAGSLRGAGTAVESVAIVVDGEGRPVVVPSSLGGRWRGARVDVSSGRRRSWRGPDGADYHVVARPLALDGPSAGWRVAALRRVASFEAAVGAIGSTLVATFAIAIALTIGILTVAMTRALGPVRRLTDAIRRTQRASEFQPLPVETKDEVGALTDSFNRMFGTIQDYERGLEDKVAERTKALAEAKREVSDILDHMAQAIFTVGAEGRVNRELSAHCHTVFGERPIAGELAVDLLQIGDADGARARMEFFFESIVGADELQWTLCDADRVAHVRYVRPQDAAVRHLDLEWAPIYAQGEIAKVMVVAKDVTDVRRLEAEVADKERQNRENVARLIEISSMDPELFESFLGEAAALLDQGEQALSRMETDPNAVHAVFRGMHTLKGNARIFHVASLQDLAHLVEERLEAVRDGREAVTPALVLDLRRGLHELRRLLGEFERLGRHLLLVRGVVDRVDALDERLERAAKRVSDARPLDEIAADARALGIPSVTQAVEAATAATGPAAGEAIAEIGRRIARVRSLASELATSADADRFVEESPREAARLAEAIDAWTAQPDGEEALHALLRATDSIATKSRDAGLRALGEAAFALEERIARVRDRRGARDPEEVSGVETAGRRLVARLEDVRAVHAARSGAPKVARHKGGTTRVAKARILELRKAYKDLARVLEPSGAVPVRDAHDALGRAVRGLTLVPLSDLFDRYRKMLRDLARDLGKRVGDLEVEGDDLLVDAQLVERLSDVVVHALRNAVDHGIERPEERGSKPPVGRVRARCRSEEGDIVVEIEDDGRGIDPEAVRSKAFALRLLDEERAAAISTADLLDLVFRPGFSLAKRVTEVSGRGVGLDVIRTTLEALRGRVSLRSTPGAGLVLSLRIPADYYQRL